MEEFSVFYQLSPFDRREILIESCLKKRLLPTGEMTNKTFWILLKWFLYIYSFEIFSAISTNWFIVFQFLVVAITFNLFSKKLLVNLVLPYPSGQNK